ncbi:MAG: hypothetical protein Q9196_000133 [Gyalolechia fulgens]
MSTYLPTVAPFFPASTDDPMELYPDLENRPTAEDGIDVDLDLTTDPPEYTDDEMIEDAEEQVGQDTIDPEVETAHDEQMIDEAVEDVGVQHDVIEDITSEYGEALDDTGFAEPSHQLGDNGHTPGQLPQSGRGSLGTTSQEITQQSIQNRSPLGSQTFSDQKADFPGSPEDGQDLNGLTDGYDETAVEELIRYRRSPSTEVSSSRKPQGAAKELQMIQAEHDRHVDQLDPFTSDAPSPLSSSKNVFEDIENGAGNAPSRVAKQGLDSPQIYAGQQCYAAEPPSSYDNFSEAPVIHQDDADTRRRDVPSESQERSDASIVPEMSHNEDANTSPEGPYVHPVVVLYEENEMFLFPPAAEEQDDDQTYFLTNEALAAEPIQILLRECRNVLEGNISDQHELEINVDALGLRICESDVDAANTTLAQVLDIYLQLHYHDGNNSPPPMALSLTTNIRFSYRLSYLSGLVATGKGISQLEQEEDSSVRADSPEITGQLRTVEPIGPVTSAAHESNVKNFPTDEIHGQPNNFAQRSAAQLSPENPRNESASVNSSVNPISTDEAGMTERSDVANGSTMTDSVPAASGKEISTANLGSTVPFHAQYSRESNVHLREEAEDFQDEADQDDGAEDGIGYEEDDDPSGNSSAGSSTVQGDNIPAVKEGPEALTKREADDDRVLSAPELVIPKPGGESRTEDVITYESNEEDGSLSDTSLQDTGNVGPEDKGAVLVQSVASLSKDAHSRYAVGENEVDAYTLAAQIWDVNVLARNGSNFDHERTDQNEGGEPEVTPIQNEALDAEEYEEIDRDGMLNPPMSQEVHRNIDQSNSTLKVVTDTVNDETAKDPAHRSTQSVVDEDEDEITFDEEIEYAVTDDPVDASTVYSSEQAVYPSPGSLKRGRACDDSADKNDTQGKTVPHVDYRGNLHC